MNPSLELRREAPDWVTPVARSFYNQYFRDDHAVELDDLLAVIYAKYFEIKDSNKHYGNMAKIEQSIKYACINELIKMKYKKEARKRNDGNTAVPFSTLDKDSEGDNIANTFADEMSDFFRLEGMRAVMVSRMNIAEQRLFQFLWDHTFRTKKEINEAVQRRFRLNRCRAYRAVENLQHRCEYLYHQLTAELSAV